MILVSNFFFRALLVHPDSDFRIRMTQEGSQKILLTKIIYELQLLFLDFFISPFLLGAIVLIHASFTKGPPSRVGHTKKRLKLPYFIES